MNEAFEKWWEENRLDFSGNLSDKPYYKAAFLAGASAMKEKAAELVNSKHISKSDLTGNGWDEWGYSEDIAEAILKMEVK